MGTATKNIVNTVLELRADEKLPAICFNDDRVVCELLAKKVFAYFEQEQNIFEATPEFKKNFEIKDEEVTFINYGAFFFLFPSKSIISK